MNSEGSGNSGRSPDKTSKLRKGSGVDGKARGSREEWKWIGSPLTQRIFQVSAGMSPDILKPWTTSSVLSDTILRCSTRFCGLSESVKPPTISHHHIWIMSYLMWKTVSNSASGDVSQLRPHIR